MIKTLPELNYKQELPKDAISTNEIFNMNQVIK